MNQDTKHMLIAMANMVYQSQACVLEMIIHENGIIAHLIPREVWEEEGEEYDAQ